MSQAKALAGAGSLIPHEMKHVDHFNRFKAQTARAGISHLQGMRHAYAQARYRAAHRMEGAGGKRALREAAEPRKKATVRDARLIIAGELGHEREQITAVCLGP